MDMLFNINNIANSYNISKNINIINISNAI